MLTGSARPFVGPPRYAEWAEPFGKQGDRGFRRPTRGWRKGLHAVSGTWMIGLMRTPLLFAAPALTGGDQPYGLVSPHAAHGSGGVHRPKDHAATPQQELRRLDVTAFLLPPSAEQLGLIFGYAIGDGKAQ